MAKEKRYISEEERLAARAKSKKKSSKSWSERSEAKGNKAAIARKPKKERKPSRFSKMSKQKKAIVLVLTLFVFTVIFGYVKNIVSLTIENKRLRAQQEQLEEKRDRLESRLKNVDNSDYIEEQARKQLRLMNPDEILFIFDEEDTNGKK